ncbi:hypothetical protein K502DRAFT_365500 [Neoconidiobolus thromboides FSU 785]|nr:hypothetical protein K502DRAFT_365500 [Neoconidiobolus thromboides FSU 785]
MKYQYISNENREMIVESYVNEWHMYEIAQVMGFKCAFVGFVVNKYIEGKDYRRELKRGPRKRAISEDHDKIMQAWINKDCTTAIRLRMKKFKFSFKYMNLITQNDLTILEMRDFYASIFQRFLQRCVKSLCALRTKDPTSLDTGSQIKDVSMHCAMNKHKIIEVQTQAKPYNVQSFHQFIGLLANKITRMNISEGIIITNNGWINKHLRISEIIRSSGHKLVCLSPYFPLLNPIQVMYTKWIQVIGVKDLQNSKESFNVADCERFYE